MCGIVGVVDLSRSTPGERLGEIATAMALPLAHRGPDDDGIWVEASAGVALGHRRLAIIDPTPAGHQPMVSADGRYVLTFNGEVYNFAELRRDLERCGRSFRGHSDTEVLLEAIAAWGVSEAIHRTNGMFALGVWDRAERTLHLARDRLGEKPLYYGRAGHSFVFASELKALRRHPEFSGEIDRSALALLLRHGYVPAPHSIYAAAAKVRPASLVTLSTTDRAREPVEAPYWSVRRVAEEGIADPLEPREVLDGLDAALRRAVKMRMVADVPLGAFLSGGIDSSTVVALMQAQSSQPVRTFTIGFDEPGYDEASHARNVARHLGTDHTELYLTPDHALEVIPRLPEIYDEPFADSSQIPTCLVAEMTRRHVTVALSGDGGDELFLGYARYHWMRPIQLARGALPRGLRRRAARALRRFSPEALDGLAARARRVQSRQGSGRFGARAHAAARLLEASGPEPYRDLMSHWMDPTRAVPGATEPATALTHLQQWASLDDVRNQMAYGDLVTYLPDDLLVKVDRAAMAVGLESRAPLLDHELVAYAWRIPLAMKVRRGTGKWAVRELLRRYVPADLVERPKHGFGVPIDRWLRGRLREWAEDLLGEDRLRREGFFDVPLVRAAWTDYVQGRAHDHSLIWDVLMFEAWLEAQT